MCSHHMHSFWHETGISALAAEVIYDKYQEDFDAYVAMIKSYGGHIGVAPGLVIDELKE